MNSSERTQYIHETCLRVLSECAGYMLPEPVFRTQANISIFPPLTVKEFETELRWLEGEQFIVGINPELGGPRKWKITDKGRAVL